jgi:hypothetical protein
MGLGFHLIAPFPAGAQCGLYFQILASVTNQRLAVVGGKFSTVGTGSGTFARFAIRSGFHCFVSLRLIQKQMMCQLAIMSVVDW